MASGDQSKTLAPQKLTNTATERICEAGLAPGKQLKNWTYQYKLYVVGAQSINDTAIKKTSNLSKTLVSRNIIDTAIKIMSNSGNVLNYGLNKDQTKGSIITRSNSQQLSLQRLNYYTSPERTTNTLALPYTNYSKKKKPRAV